MTQTAALPHLRDDIELPGVTIVIPCLNEEKTLPLVLNKLAQLRQTCRFPIEVIVSDNGSSDGSPAIAQSFGVKTLACPVKGYGAALRKGILAAGHEYVLFADADNTYDFLEAPRLLQKLREGYDFVIGSRMDGDIKPGAMPCLHRYLGTPVLNLIINGLYARNAFRVRDCNSGFRGFRKSAFVAWGVESDGMEFASEMLIKAMLAGTRMVHVPISLYPDDRGRVPHLKTWRDGMRHLLQVLLYSPSFFNRLGSLIFLVSWVVLLVSACFGPIKLGVASLFELHTMMFALLAAIFGQTIWGIGLFIAAKRPTHKGVYHSVVHLGEDRLFWTSGAFICACLAIFAGVFASWAHHGFSALQMQRETLLLISIGATGILFVSQSITAHLLKRA